jgi:phosphoglycolate phosphatase
MNATKEIYEVILFDLDGTLTDPKEGLTKGVQYALQSFGIFEPDLDKLEKFIGPPLNESFSEFYNFDKTQAEQAVAKYREYYGEKGLYENIVYPLIPQLLADLFAHRKILIVATTKLTSFAEQILKNFDILKYFTLVSGSNLDGTRNTKAAVINYALTKTAIEPSSKVVIVGDRKYDIIGARETGINSIGILYGYGSLAELTQAKPNHIVQTVQELRELLI